MIQEFRIAADNDVFVRRTGVFLLKAAGDTYYRSLGKISAHSFDPKPDVVELDVPEDFGFLRTVRKDVRKLSLDLKLTLLEENAQTVLVKFFAQALSSSSQAAISDASGTATLTSVVQGLWHPLGKKLLTDTPVVKVASSAKTIGTDFVLDRVNGYLYVVVGGGIADAATVDVTSIDCAAVTEEVFEAASRGKLTGTGIFVETDEESTNVRARWEGSCDVFRSGAADRGVQDFEKVDVTVAWSSKPRIYIPPVATTTYGMTVNS